MALRWHGKSGMTSFNYRVFRTRWKYNLYDEWIEEDSYTIQEIYYDEEGNIEGCTSNPYGMSPFGDTLEELQRNIQTMLTESTWPVLTPKDIPGYLYETDEVTIPEDEL